MPIVIGLLGEKRSGKGTFVKLLTEIAKPKTMAQVRSVDVLYETCKIWDIEPTRANLQNLAIAMDEKFGAGTLTHAVGRRISEIDADIIVFDGVRWKTDEELVRSFDKNYLVYVTANTNLRWERGKIAGEKSGEDKTSFEEFMREEGAYTEQFISEIGSRADFKIVNEGILEDYRAEVTRFWGQAH